MFTKRQYLGGAGTFCGFCIVALDARDKVHARKMEKWKFHRRNCACGKKFEHIQKL